MDSVPMGRGEVKMRNKYLDSNNSKSPIGTCAFIFQLVFIIMKLVDAVDWKWWVVLLPTFVSVAYVMVFILIGLGAVTILNWMDKHDG